MVLYYGVTTYHLLCCLVHKLAFHPNADAILYISDTHPDAATLLLKMQAEGVYREVHLFPDKGRLPKGELREDKLDGLLQHLATQTEKLLPHPITQFEEINIAGDQYLLGMYLCVRRIGYSLFEEGLGLLSRPQVLKENIRRINPLQLQLFEQMEKTNRNAVIKTYYGDMSKQEEGFHHLLAQNFSVRTLLSAMEERQIATLLHVFGADQYPFAAEEQSVLLLTQQYINFGFMTMDEQRTLYALLLDYFCPGRKVYIKPHPSDLQALYGQWFPDSVVLSRFMPSELLPYCRKGKFDIGLTACSTSIHALSELFGQTICFDQQIEKTFLAMHRYYAAAAVLAQMGCTHAVCSGINIPLLKQFVRTLGAKTELYALKSSETSEEIIVLDHWAGSSEELRSWMANAGAGKTWIFLNSYEEYLFASDNGEPDERLHYIPLQITNENGTKELLMLAVYTDNPQVWEMIKDMKLDKKLPYCSQKLTLDLSADMELNYTRGMLYATQAHLLDALEENHALREQLTQSKKKRKLT